MGGPKPPFPPLFSSRYCDAYIVFFFFPFPFPPRRDVSFSSLGGRPIRQHFLGGHSWDGLFFCFYSLFFFPSSMCAPRWESSLPITGREYLCPFFFCSLSFALAGFARRSSFFQTFYRGFFFFFSFFGSGPIIPMGTLPFLFFFSLFPRQKNLLPFFRDTPCVRRCKSQSLPFYPLFLFFSSVMVRLVPFFPFFREKSEGSPPHLFWLPRIRTIPIPQFLSPL